MEEKPVVPGKKEKGRVRFNSTASSEPPVVPTVNIELSPNPTPSRSNEGTPPSPVRRPRPSIIRGSSYNSVLDMVEMEDHTLNPTKLQSAMAAHQRAQSFAAAMSGSHSAPGSRRGSLDSEIETMSPNTSGNDLLSPALPPDVSEKVSIELDRAGREAQERRNINTAAYELVKAHVGLANTLREDPTEDDHRAPISQLDNLDGYYEDEGLLSPTGKPREGVLTNLLKLYRVDEVPRKDFSGYTTPASSGTVTPTRRKWYDQNNGSTGTLASLAAASAILANPNEKRHRNPTTGPRMTKHKRTASGKFKSMVGGRPRMEEEARITIHVANILKRQEFILKLCRALMMYGAPTHRLEEYLRMMARFLEIDGQFLYLPACMIISFDDMSTHTTEVKIIRSAQGVNLGKLKDAHEIYKEVLHAVIEVDEAIARLDGLIRGKDHFNPWTRVLMYGLASATVAPFAFDGRPIDMPICFLLGCFIGFLQLIVAPRSDVVNNVFEIGAAVVTSFLARAFGSIRGGELFCFSAIAQSSICLILPGYLVLCAALELQSKAIVPGSIRMVYAIIYSLFLGFGITIGTAIYGWIDENATSETTCRNTLDSHWNFAFVPAFAFCLTYVNQAKWKQMPVMIIIAMVGYIVNYFLTARFPNSSQICNTISALAVGICANLYSRVRHGVAAAALLPAIFVQVPSGLAATGSLLSGLSTANELTNSSSAVNGTTTVSVGDENLDTVVFNVAASMIEIAVGITVGLFFATLLIYPLGKRRSGLFTF